MVADGNVYSVKDVKGLLTLLPYVSDYELFTIEENGTKIRSHSGITEDDLNQCALWMQSRRPE
jgi:hypothetical protein